MTKFSQEKLENVAENSLYTTFTNKMTIEYSFEVFKRFLKKGTILELGPAEGLMTNFLKDLDQNLTVIEGSKIFANQLQDKYPSIHVINSLFEEAQLDKKFDNIVLGHVLEHVKDPHILLNHIKPWLKEDGIILCAVPNAQSLHRQAAVAIGFINSVFEMSEKDIHHGHMRIYTPETLQEDFLKAGYKIEHRGGYWLKPLTDSQLEIVLDEPMLRGFMKLGESYPDIAGEIYIVATL